MQDQRNLDFDELIRRQVTVIAATGTPAALAAKAATSTIPIVFTAGVDPIAAGLIGSLNRPSGNLTARERLPLCPVGKAIGAAARAGSKRRRDRHASEPQLSRRRVPGERCERSRPHYRATSPHCERQQRKRYRQRLCHPRSTAGRRTAGRLRCFLPQPPGSIVALAARHALPTIYSVREFVFAGDLMIYAPDLRDGYRQASIYVGRILKGAKPSDLPVVQPTKFDFVINLKTAKALGLEIPPKLLALADEVIE